MEREIIKEHLTKCHIDELMSEDDVKTKQTEIQANYINMSVRPVKRRWFFYSISLIFPVILSKKNISFNICFLFFVNHHHQ